MTSSSISRTSIFWGVLLLLIATLACNEQRPAKPAPIASASGTSDKRAIAPSSKARAVKAISGSDAGQAPFKDAGAAKPKRGAPPGEVARRPRLKFIEIVTADADPETSLPLVVAVHGLGGSPYGFKRLFKKVRFKARVVLPQAPTQWKSGYS